MESMLTIPSARPDLRLTGWRWLLLVVTIAAAAWLFGCSADAPALPSPAATEPVIAQPYAGLRERAIGALAPDRIDDLLAGRGAGYALAAELNHYPGPTHVLELATAIQLSSSQGTQVQTVFDGMRQDARALGQQLVELEAALDERFRSGQITDSEVADLTTQIADVEGRLRSVHLTAHVRMKEILDPAQVARYDTLRGYEDPGEGPVQGHSSDHAAH